MRTPRRLLACLAGAFFSLLRKGGVYLAHNAVLMKDSMKDFLDRVQKHPDLVTVIAQTSDDGFAVSYRRK